MFEINDECINKMAREIYSSIVGNHNIPNDIKNAWLELCITSSDIYALCDY